MAKLQSAKYTGNIGQILGLKRAHGSSSAQTVVSQKKFSFKQVQVSKTFSSFIIIIIISYSKDIKAEWCNIQAFFWRLQTKRKRLNSGLKDTGGA